MSTISNLSAWRIALISGLVACLVLTLLLSSKHHDPEVVVNMPRDAVPLEQLPPPEPAAGVKVVEGQRAVLWWTVYSKTLDKTGWSNRSIEAANAAVEKVYGPPPGRDR